MAFCVLLCRNALVLLLVMAAAGCASLARTSFSLTQQDMAQIPGIPNARFWGDASAEDLAPIIHMDRMHAAAQKIGRMDFLAISSGASDGAFGAGVLNGLTAHGERPEYVFVSGVSAGALIAPLAFLGPRYDKELKRAWTSGIAEPLGEGGIFSILFSQESRRTALHELVSSFVDEAMLRQIAEQHRLGRRLLVVTTNLDAQRPVVWDLGAIAASGSPNALALFRDVLTASASIPGAFAPTLIEVEAGGKRFNELHVDGGASVQVFTIPEAILVHGLPGGRSKPSVPSRFFIIINNRLTPEFEVVEGATVPVLNRSLSSLIKTNSRLTLVATREFTRTRGIDFNLAYIGDGFPTEPKPSFETSYMNSLYRFGFEEAARGQAWHKDIPFVNEARPRLLAGQR
jgi:hypothetical protein